MASLPPDFNQNSGINEFQSNGTGDINEASSEITSVSLSPEEQERVQDTSQRLRRMFLILVSVGAGFGLILAIALVMLLSRFGLVGTPQESTPPSETLQQLM